MHCIGSNKFKIPRIPKQKTLFDLQTNHPVFNIIMHAYVLLALPCLEIIIVGILYNIGIT